MRYQLLSCPGRARTTSPAQEIPTFRVPPLNPQCDAWCEFPVADRPNAVRQFLDAAAADASLIRAPWLLLIETDYVWMSPLQGVPLAEGPAPGWAFPYGYIVPTYPGRAVTPAASLHLSRSTFEYPFPAPSTAPTAARQI